MSSAPAPDWLVPGASAFVFSSQVDLIHEAEVGDGSSSRSCTGVELMQGFFHVALQDDVKQGRGRETAVADSYCCCESFFQTAID